MYLRLLLYVITYVSMKISRLSFLGSDAHVYVFRLSMSKYTYVHICSHIPKMCVLRCVFMYMRPEYLTACMYTGVYICMHISVLT